MRTRLDLSEVSEDDSGTGDSGEDDPSGEELDERDSGEEELLAGEP